MKFQKSILTSAFFIISIVLFTGTVDRVLAQTLPTTVFYPVSVNPPQGNGPSTTFKVAYYDQHGATAISQIFFFVMSKALGTAAHSCLVEYDQPSNSLYLMNDAGTAWVGPSVLGTGGTLSNSQCSFTGSAAQKSIVNTINLVLTLPINFTSAFYGNNILRGAVVENGVSSGYINVGSFTATATATQGELIDTLSYFLTQHPTTALRLSTWNDNGAFENQVVETALNRAYLTKWGPRSFLGYTWDSNYIYFQEEHEFDYDGSNPANPSIAVYSFAPGYWMTRSMHVGDAIDGTATGNVPTTITYMNPNCQVSSSSRYYMKTVLEGHYPNFNLGGTLGTQDVIVLRVEQSQYSEKEFYAKGYGFVGWLKCSLDGSVCDTSVAGGGGYINTVDSLPARNIDNRDACVQSFKPVVNTPSLQSNAVTLTATYTDDADVTKLDSALLLVAPKAGTPSTANACLLSYAPATKVLSLYNDAGTAVAASAVVGSNTTLANSQCSVLVSGVTATASGRVLTLTAPITFTANFSADKSIWTKANELSQGAVITNGWQSIGTLTGTVAPPGSLASITASAIASAVTLKGLGAALTFALTGTVAPTGSLAAMTASAIAAIVTIKSIGATLALVVPHNLPALVYRAMAL